MEVSEKHKDALLEIINIGIGRGANVLNQIVEHHVTLETPSLDIFDEKSLMKFLATWTDKDYAAVEMGFSSTFSGSGLLIFPTEKANKLVKLFVRDLHLNNSSDILNISALTEISNIIINSVFSTLSEQFEIELKYAIPEYRHGLIDDIIKFEPDEYGKVVLLCKTSFKVIELDISGNLLLVFSIKTFNELLSMIDQYYANLFQKK
jgi:chemotaxis protein CheC